MFTEIFEDPKERKNLRGIFEQLNEGLGMNLNFKDASSPYQFANLIQQTRPFLEARCDTLYRKLEIDQSTAEVIESGATSAAIGGAIKTYMSDCGFVYEPANATFVRK